MTSTQDEQLRECPFCQSTEHLTLSACGSMTGDMPSRPYRAVCTHLDCDYVQGPVGYGRQEARRLWNKRASLPAPDTAGEVVAWFHEPYICTRENGEDC